MCVHCETCGLALALEHTGDVYCCGHFVEPRYRLGNIAERHMLELVSSEQQRAFGLAKADALPRYCRECDVRFACHGGCPKDRFVKTPDGEPGLNYLCPSFKLFFDHVTGAHAADVHAARPRPRALGARALYATRDARRGRNEPCTCEAGASGSTATAATRPSAGSRKQSRKQRSLLGGLGRRPKRRPTDAAILSGLEAGALYRRGMATGRIGRRRRRPLRARVGAPRSIVGYWRAMCSLSSASGSWISSPLRSTVTVCSVPVNRNGAL